MKLFFRRGALTALVLNLITTAFGAELSWPPDHYLPSFKTPAAQIDCIELTRYSGPKADLFTSLEGLVNRTKPRLACVTGGRGEGRYTWMDIHRLSHATLDGYDAILKYRAEIHGLVVTDPDLPDTLNLATTMAGINGELICHPTLLKKLTNAPYNLRVIDDLRDRFQDKYEVYAFLYSNYWPRCTHRIMAGMEPHLHGNLRDFLVAVKSATVWLSPAHERDKELLRLFAADLKPAQSLYMGWWPGEGDGLEWIGQYGVPVLASDFFCNATVFGGVTQPIVIPAIPPPPPLTNKVYVALILSDGDNVQYMQHVMKMEWGNPIRGSFPVGWTASPLAVELDPGLLNYYWSSATTNDCLISGPSGAGYAHVNHWTPEHLSLFAHSSAPYLAKSGLRIITVWDNVTDDVTAAFARDCPTLLGFTDQSGERHGTNNILRTIGLTPTYTSTVGEMIAGITNATHGWHGQKPLFLAAQANVWNLRLDGLQKVVAALDPNKYCFVRPDQLFQLSYLARPAQP